MLEGTIVTWEDIGAIVAVAAMFAAYLYYIHAIYPRSLTREIDRVEKEYYECYDIREVDGKVSMRHSVKELPRSDKPWVSLSISQHEEYDPGDEQPQR